MGIFRFLRRKKYWRSLKKYQQYPLSAKSASFRKRKSFPIHAIITALSALILLASSIFTIINRPIHGNSEYIVGQIAHSDLYAQCDFDYDDHVETEKKRLYTESSIAPHYRFNPKLNDVSIQEIRSFFRAINGKLETPTINLKKESLQLLRAIFHTEKSRRHFLEITAMVIADGVMRPEDKQNHDHIVLIDSKDRVQRKRGDAIYTPESAANTIIEAFLKEIALPEETNASTPSILAKQIKRLIMVNLIFDYEFTKRLKDKARKNILLEKGTIKKGDLLLRRGKVVNKQNFLRIRAHNQALRTNRHNKEYGLQLISLSMLSTLIILTSGFYLFYIFPKLFRTPRILLFISITLALNLLFSSAVESFLLRILNGGNVFIHPLLPLTFAPILITLLFGPQLGIASGILVALLTAFQTDEVLTILVVGIVSSSIGIFAIRNANTRIRTFRAAFFIALAIFLVQSVYMLRAQTPLYNYPIILLSSLINGFVILILVNLLLPLCEYSLDLSTNISLLELSDLNHPLLQRLQIEAPGTYHHTLMVASLAEASANAIKANPRLARVASYFHDIGKLFNPTYFTENNPMDKQHKKLNPRISALLIINHVKEGLRLAEKYKLQKTIRRVIASHHGTSLVYYFYHQAMKSEVQTSPNSNNIGEKDYRYTGPLPQTKEEVIISLADSCEAALRSLQNPSPKMIHDRVMTIVNDRIMDSQLSESELTFSELSIVQETISKTLINILHTRISYPDKTTHENHTNTKDKKEISDSRLSNVRVDQKSGGGTPVAEIHEKQ